MSIDSLPYINRKTLSGWAGPNELREGKRLFDMGLVTMGDMDGMVLRGTVHYNQREVLTRFRFLKDGSIENLCPCRDSRERGVVCVHAIALGLMYVDKHSDSRTDRRIRIQERKSLEQALLGPAGFIQRVPRDTQDAVPASLRLKLDKDWDAGLCADEVPLIVQVRYRSRNQRVSRVPSSLPLAFDPAEEDLLYILEDMAGGPIGDSLVLSRADLVDLLEEKNGTPLMMPDGETGIDVSRGEVIPHVEGRIDPTSGNLKLSLRVDGLNHRSSGLSFIISRREGWVVDGHCFHPLGDILPEEYRDLYSGTVTIPRSRLIRFLDFELARLEEKVLVDLKLPRKSIRRTVGEPSFRLRINGNHEELLLELDADYAGFCCPASALTPPHDAFAAPDPEDVMAYFTRDLEREQQALADIEAFGLQGTRGDRLTSVHGTRLVMDFLAGRIPAIREMGWTVEYGGWLEALTRTADWITPEITVRSNERHAGEFDVSFRYLDKASDDVPMHLVEEAYIRGESCIQMDDKTLLIDRDLFQAFHDILDECGIPEAVAGEWYRVSEVHTGFFAASAATTRGLVVKGIDAIESTASRQNRSLEIPSVPLNDFLAKTLRPYQHDGLNWLRFLEEGEFAGILADEMGLGKTIQALAWIQMIRCRQDLRSAPALVVCPTSLVVNWAEESKRFTPDTRVLILSGHDRRKSWKKIAESDLVITSYALLRRDIDLYRNTHFSVAILDEAQHIKNHSTQNARCAKQLNASCRLVLTGTPIENSVSDLWSIMDFLMPGYLGSHAKFRRNYEQPITTAGPEAEVAHGRLRKKIHPFLLRRLKSEVAKELPDKLDRVAYCEMSADQRRVYRSLLEETTRQITEMVESQGFNRSRFTIFRTLTRLRQTCCHLDLLKIPGQDFKQPSGKLELFMELLDEAIDGGHRVLVFSQFVSMLHILRNELKKRKIRYSYLDGSTTDRMKRVHEFNDDPGIPLFLISLKAGGTGLNLTGADMVIHFDPWWNPAVEDQATDRAHRIGQDKTVYNIKLITRDSIEEKVLAMQLRKREVIDATLSKQADLGKSLSWEDIRELLSLE